MTTRTDPDKFFQMRSSATFRRDIDVLRRHEEDIPTAAEMVRRLVDRAVRALPDAGKPAKRSRREG